MASVCPYVNLKTNDPKAFKVVYDLEIAYRWCVLGSSLGLGLGFAGVSYAPSTRCLLFALIMRDNLN